MNAKEKKALTDAISSLRVMSINLFSTNMAVHEAEELEKLEENERVTQSYHGCSKIDEVGGKNANEEAIFNYVFYFEAGVRIISKEDDDKSESDSEHKVTPLFSMTSIFKARYYSDVKLSEDSMKAFAQKNAGFNVWPYWRELVQSTCCKAGIEPIQIPLYRC